MKRKKWNKKLHRELMYFAFCVNYDLRPQFDDSYKKWEEFKERKKYHLGDCVAVCTSCERCEWQELEVIAQNMMDSAHHIKGANYRD